MMNVRRSSRPPLPLPGVGRLAWLRAESSEMNAVFIRFFWLRLPREFLRRLQERFVRKDLVVTGKPPPPDDPLLIHEKECPLGIYLAWRKTVVSFGHLQVRKVTEERVWELERVRKCLLREGVVGADRENLDVQILEFAVIGLPGR